MKAEKEIQTMAAKKYGYSIDEIEAYKDGYTQCQQDTAAKLTQLKEAIKKHTWYDEDGFPQVNLYAIENLLID